MDAQRVGISDSRHSSADLDNFSLPGWIYRDADFLEAEKEAVFATSWQVVCHLSDIPESGDFHTLEFLGEPLVAVRRPDGGVQGVLQRLPPPRRAAAGRRRAAARAASPAPTTPGPTTWTGGWPPCRRSKEFEDFAMDRHGLKSGGLRGLPGLRVRAPEAGLPSVAEMLSPIEAELAAYRFEDLQPHGPGHLPRRATVNWKNVTDNYSDALHIPVAHPGLTRLFGMSYGIEAADLGRQDVGLPA